MSHRYEPRAARLPKFLSEVMTGQISPPMFQREFVWSDTQRLELLDSVWRDRPFGAIFLWETNREYPTHLKLGPVRLLHREQMPPFPSYLIDGLQRVTTLYAALAPGLLAEIHKNRRRYGVVDVPDGALAIVDADAADKRSREEWEIFFDASAETDVFKLRTARMKRGGKVPDAWVSTWELLDSDQVRARIKTDPFAKNKAWADRVEACQDTLKDYFVVMIPLTTDDPEEAVTAFTRINRGGTPMDETALTHARVWQLTEGTTNLLERIQVLRDHLAPVGFDDLKDATLLNAVILTAGKPVSSLKQRDEREVASLIANDAGDLLSRTEKALSIATRFLHEKLFVCGQSMLPSNWHLLFLVVAAKELHDDEALVSRVRRWFMATTYAEVLSANLRVQEELEHFLHRVLGASGDAGTPRPSPDPVDAVQSTGRFDLRSGRNKAFALTLLSLANEHAGSASAHACARLLAQTGTHALPRLLEDGDPNLPEGRVLLDPRELEALRRELSRPFREIPSLARRHLISEVAHAAFVAGDADAFLIERRKSVDAHEGAYVRALGLSWIPDEPVR